MEEKTRKSRRGRHNAFTMVDCVRISLLLLVLLDNFIFCLLEFLVEFFMESIFRSFRRDVRDRTLEDLERLEQLLLDANVVGRVLRMKSHDAFKPGRALNIGGFEFERIKSDTIGDNIVVVRRGKLNAKSLTGSIVFSRL